MAKEWISSSDGRNLKYKRETLLNYGLNRWGLNKAHSVGPTSELIRTCAPSTFEEWENFYFSNAAQKKKNGLRITREYIIGLGQTLYVKLTEIVQKELLSITEDECIDYAYNLVLNRTYEGYVTEIETIYGQLEGALGRKIEPAPDNWDRAYSVDFSIKVEDSFIGIQIKPILSGQSLNQYQWIEMHSKNHEKFERDFGGKVFFVYSIKSSGKKKRIYNVEVIEEIRAEINRLEE
ncbi:MAG: MjaI family restriction endonuclease [Bacteroidetes bacterium]|nr:MjaI family restriction endonuclease [Bacteroidota bacterium]MBL7103722.1 MjaI family restriction endonuclease [Bacteroidales bacterium]